MAVLAALASAFLLFARPAAASERVQTAFQDVRLTAEIVPAGGGRFAALKVYARRGRRAELVYIHPGSAQALRFEKSGFCDFFGDGSPALLYRSRDALGRALDIVRYGSPYFKRVGLFPDGRVVDLDDDGQREILSQRRPLGRWFSLACGGFTTAPSHALAASVWAWNGRAFADVSGRYPGFWERREADDRAALDAARVDRRKRPGLFMGRAVTVFFDEAARGRKRAGWLELSRLIESSGAPRSCAREARARLREPLEIPADWP